MFSIDFNCDMGEGFGQYTFGNDAEIMKYISSANIACGFHSGDPAIMNKTVKLALENNVSIGAHPGLPDLQGFGRRMIAISPCEAYELVLYQVGALNAFVTAQGGILRHVKPHGALYNMAAVDAKLAKAIAEAIYDLNSEITLYGLAGSELTKAGTNIGIPIANEVFSDRTYQNDGTLTPRSHPHALITKIDDAIGQAMKMVKEGQATSIDGINIPIKADTICLHGDGADALKFAEKMYEKFAMENIHIKAI